LEQAVDSAAYRIGRFAIPQQTATKAVWRDHRLVAFSVTGAVRIVLVLLAVTWPLEFHQSSILLDVQTSIPLIVFAMSFAALTGVGAHREAPQTISGEMFVGGCHVLLASLVALPTTLLVHTINPKSLHILVEATASAAVALLASALLSRMIFRILRSSLVRRVLIIGDGPVADDVARRLAQDPFAEPVAMLSLDPRFCGQTLADDCQTRRIDLVLVVLPWGANHRLHEIVDHLHSMPIDVRIFPDLSLLRQEPTSLSALGGLPLLGIADRPLEGWSPFLKRAEDLALGVVALTLSLPALILVAIAIKLDSRGPILFHQPRVGYRHQLFEILKFRTMHVGDTDIDAARLVTPGDPRVTRVGAWLRSTSLDELPQLLNVIKGDMSLVGPRPHALLAKAGNVLYPEAVERYTARFRIRPGITGWAQVNGWRGETDTLEKIRNRVEYDLFYISHWSLRLDLMILLKTAGAVLSRRNAL
jgi:Undecaprenyl-phosphate glucose phosphotransferase